MGEEALGIVNARAGRQEWVGGGAPLESGRVGKGSGVCGGKTRKGDKI